MSLLKNEVFVRKRSATRCEWRIGNAYFTT